MATVMLTVVYVCLLGSLLEKTGIEVILSPTRTISYVLHNCWVKITHSFFYIASYQHRVIVTCTCLNAWQLTDILKRAGKVHICVCIACSLPMTYYIFCGNQGEIKCWYWLQIKLLLLSHLPGRNFSVVFLQLVAVLFRCANSEECCVLLHVALHNALIW